MQHVSYGRMDGHILFIDIITNELFNIYKIKLQLYNYNNSIKILSLHDSNLL